MVTSRTHEWDLWYPQAGATGLPFGRGRLTPSPVLLVHAAPRVLTVTIRDSEGRVVAEGHDLEADGQTPMTRLRVDYPLITREEIWPTDEDLERPVLLPGGEVGILKSWWNSEDQQEWRWQIELYNHR